MFLYFFLKKIYLLPSAAGPDPVALHVYVVAGGPELVSVIFGVKSGKWYLFFKKNLRTWTGPTSVSSGGGRPSPWSSRWRATWM